GLVDVLDPISDVPEVAATGILLGVPVVGELQRRALVFPRLFQVAGSRQTNQGEPTFLAFHAGDFNHAQMVAVETQRFVEIGDAHHGMKVFHVYTPCLKLSRSLYQISRTTLCVSAVGLGKQLFWACCWRSGCVGQPGGA